MPSATHCIPCIDVFIRHMLRFIGMLDQKSGKCPGEVLFGKNCLWLTSRLGAMPMFSTIMLVCYTVKYYVDKVRFQPYACNARFTQATQDPKHASQVK